MKHFINSILALTVVAMASSASTSFAKTTPAKATKADSSAATWKVDAEQSAVKWEGGKKLVTTTHHGTVKVKSGELQAKGDEITGGRVDIDMTSIADEDLSASPKDQSKLVGHLKSKDFFSIEEFPTANFKITSMKPMKSVAPGGATHEVTGDLTIKGKSNPVTFPMTVTKSGDMATATGMMTFDRTKYDIRYGSGKFFENLGDKVIKDEVKLDLKIVAKK